MFRYEPAMEGPSDALDAVSACALRLAAMDEILMALANGPSVPAASLDALALDARQVSHALDMAEGELRRALSGSRQAG